MAVGPDCSWMGVSVRMLPSFFGMGELGGMGVMGLVGVMGELGVDGINEIDVDW